MNGTCVPSQAAGPVLSRYNGTNARTFRNQCSGGWGGLKHAFMAQDMADPVDGKIDKKGNDIEKVDGQEIARLVSEPNLIWH